MKYLLFGAGAAFVGMLPLPIDAYLLIRWIVAGTCAFGAYETFKSTSEDKSKGVILAVIALIYNPLFPFYLNRSLWLIIDAIVGCFLIWILSVANPSASNQPGLSLEDVASQYEGKLKQIEKKSDSFVKQLLFNSIVLLVSILVILFILKT